jgi:formate-dependent nitrite reductase membrane component NrfD
MQAMRWEWGIKEAPAREWAEGKGALIAVSMFMGGIAGGSYLMSLYFDNIWGMLIAWIFAAGMGLVDMAHLKKPMRVWRIAFKANSSWISRGFVFVILFLGAAGLQLLIHLISGAAASAPNAGEVFFRIVAGILAFGVAVYSGFVVGFVNGIKFWNSALLPVMVVAGGLAGGAAIVLAISSITSAASFEAVRTAAILSTAAYAVSVFIHLWISTYSSTEAKDSAMLLLKGSLAGLFWMATVLIGMVAVLILELVAGADASALLIVSAVLFLAGNLVLRYSIIKAGLYAPLTS